MKRKQGEGLTELELIELAVTTFGEIEAKDGCKLVFALQAYRAAASELLRRRYSTGKCPSEALYVFENAISRIETGDESTTTRATAKEPTEELLEGLPNIGQETRQAFSFRHEHHNGEDVIVLTWHEFNVVRRVGADEYVRFVGTRLACESYITGIREGLEEHLAPDFATLFLDTLHIVEAK